MSNNIAYDCKFCKSRNPLNIDKIAPFAGKPYYINCNQCGKEIAINIPHNIKGNDKTFLPPNNKTSSINSSSPLQPYLVLVNSKYNSEQNFALQIGSFILGRLRNNDGDIIPDIVIMTTDPYISNRHCKITVSKNEGVYKIILEDTSTNGTYLNTDVNGMKLEKGEAVYLQNNDFFTIGDNSRIKLFYS